MQKIIFFISLILFLPAHKLLSETSEYQLKAAFLFNFTQFVTWPPESIAQHDSPFTICIFGEDPFGSTIDAIVAGEKVINRPIVIERINSEEQLSACQIVFLSEASIEETAFLLRKVSGKPILTVGESASFAELGGVIGWYLEENKLKLQINLRSAKTARLNISSKLLRLCEVIEAEE